MNFNYKHGRAYLLRKYGAVPRFSAPKALQYARHVVCKDVLTCFAESRRRPAY